MPSKSTFLTNLQHRKIHQNPAGFFQAMHLSRVFTQQLIHFVNSEFVYQQFKGSTESILSQQLLTLNCTEKEAIA